ncbi:MAG: AAA domain-containing protein [Candidatus Moranbacteria bacterium]|nr:AAA domain-containing protein [Candidatus Moranbacteria bacterium]
MTKSTNSNITSKFTKHMRNAIEKAKEIAQKADAESISTLHLLRAIALEKGSVGQNILQEIGLNNLNQSQTTKSKTANKKPRVRLAYSEKLKHAFKQATKIAAQYHYPYIGTEHMIYAIMNSDEETIRHLLSNQRKSNTNEKNAQTATSMKPGLGSSRSPKMAKMKMPDFIKAINPTNTIIGKDKSVNILEKYASHLNKENSKRDVAPVVGRNDEIERIISVLLRKNKNNPVLIGEPGVGKTAIVSALAQRINQGEVPIYLNHKVIWELDMGMILSGTSFRGEFEQRMKSIIDYASNNQEVILFIDEIHNLMGAGNAVGSMDAANILKPALAKGKIKIIGATTLDEYKKYIEKDPALERRFQPIYVKEPSKKQVREILKGIKKNYEEHHQVTIDEKAIEAAINLSGRYINDRFLPDKAIDLIDEAQARVKAKAISYEMTKKMKRCYLQKEKINQLKKKLVIKNEFQVASSLKKDEEDLNKILVSIMKEQDRRRKMTFLRITEQDIKEIVSIQTGIPVQEVIDDQNILVLNKKLKKKIIGQNQAIEVIGNTLQKAFAGINDPQRPLGSFVFLGPTGVGKTYLAKTLAKMLFKNQDSFVRIDMSEFSEKYNISRLIGAPAGYVGFEEGGKLTEKVRRNPFSLILFDEIEKGHPDVFNLFLQILEDGVLTDASGRKINFKNTVIIFTSNIGVDEFLNKSIGFAENKDTKQKSVDSEKKDRVINKLKETLLPELVNRIDNLLVFNQLTKKDLQEIAQIEISKINKRLKEKKAQLKYDKKTLTWLARQSQDSSEGARLLRKNIEEMIKNPAAKIILNRKSLAQTAIKTQVKNNQLKLQESKQK